MLRTLLLLLCLTGTAHVFAQKAGGSLPKATEKHDDAKIDYEQPGSPMPPLKLLVYYDTITKRDTASINEQSRKGTEKDENKKISRRKKKHHSRDDIAASTSDKKQYLTNEDLDNDANLLVMLFNPNCSHCQDETEMLEKNIFYFNKTTLVMVASPLTTLYLPNFVQSYHLADYPSICLGIDSSNFLNKVFLYKALPQINVYDKHRKLVKIFTGDVAIDSLKGYIQ